MRLPRIPLSRLLPAAMTDRVASWASRLPWPGRGEPMSALKRRVVKTVCYSLFGLALFAVFFGFGYLENHLERLVRQGLAGQDAVAVQWTDLTVVPGLPPHLTAVSCVVTDKATGAALVGLSDVSLRPALGGLLAGRLGVGFEASAWDGRVDGTVGTASFGLNRLRLALDTTAVDLAKVPQLAAMVPGLAGLVTMDMVCTVPLDDRGAPDMTAGEGSLWATVSGGRMKNMIPLFTVETLEVARAVVELDFDGPSLGVDRLDVDSRVIQGSLDGTVDVDWADLGKTRLDLRGQVSPDPELTVLEVLEPRAAKAIRQGRPISIEITDTLATAMVRMR